MKNWLIACTLTFLAFAAAAQPNKERLKERIDAQKVAFITQRLNLTPDEAKQFWPLYNEFEDKLTTIRGSAKPEKPLDEMTDAEVEKRVASEFDRQTRELELKKEYYQKFRKVISVKKTAKLYRAERDFRAELLERLNNKRQERQRLLRDDGN